MQPNRRRKQQGRSRKILGAILGSRQDIKGVKEIRDRQRRHPKPESRHDLHPDGVTALIVRLGKEVSVLIERREDQVSGGKNRDGEGEEFTGFRIRSANANQKGARLLAFGSNDQTKERADSSRGGNQTPAKRPYASPRSNRPPKHRTDRKQSSHRQARQKPMR